MYYLTFRGVKRPIPAGVFWPLFIGAICVIIASMVVVVAALGWLAFIGLILVTGAVTLNNGKEYALIKNEQVRKWLGFSIVITAVLVYFGVV